MLVEAVLALSLAGGGDLATSEIARSRGFYKERNVFCSTTGKCVGYTFVCTSVGTVAADLVNKKWGPKAGWFTVGVFAAVPVGAAIHNTIVLNRRRK